MGEVKQLQAPRLSRPERLTGAHDTSRFDCGKPQLNEWLRDRALESETTAITYVACEGVRVAGYYAISTGSVIRGEMPSKMRRQQGLPHTIPVAIIGRLARDLSYRGTGLGPSLLQDALKRILQASEQIGIHAVLVHALDDDSTPFYKDNGFLESPINPRTFFLPLATLRKAL